MRSTLLLDLNSFFASCEQQEQPQLRGVPVAVAPVMAETTCAIAASYEAKAFGIRTGTPIWEARKRCPDLRIVQARPKLYVEYHHRILKAVGRLLPIDQILSIDEFSCRLDRSQQDETAAIRLAKAIKEAIRDEVGICLTSSIGIAPNVLLAKIASNMQKPDGLVLLGPHNLPQAILHLDLIDMPGVGRNMVTRLQKAGITTVAELWRADAFRLRLIWNGVAGAKFHLLLHGGSVAPTQTVKHSIGHQHVLAPTERTKLNATPILRQLVIRATQRLRDEGYYCRRLALDIKWARQQGSGLAECSVHETQDTTVLLRVFEDLWRDVPPLFPLRVGIMLSGLVPQNRHQLDLFERPQRISLSAAVDKLNERFGRGTVQFGQGKPAMISKIAFRRVPELSEF